MDFSKAFDKFHDGRLIQIIKSHGIQGDLVDRIEDGKSFGGSFSDWSSVASDFPQ